MVCFISQLFEESKKEESLPNDEEDSQEDGIVEDGNQNVDWNNHVMSHLKLITFMIF